MFNFTGKVLSLTAASLMATTAFVSAQSMEELVTAAGNIGTTIFHPVGTCRMGRDGDESAVVDPQLRVRGIDRLRVIDASIMPTITSGNTNSPTLMIAERAAEMLTARSYGTAGAMTTVAKTR